MALTTQNPYTLETKSYKAHTKKEVLNLIDKADKCYQKYKFSSIPERISYLKSVRDKLKKNRERYAKLMTQEMGKPYKESLAEVDKCVKLCSYYIKNTGHILQNSSKHYKTKENIVSYRPLGVVLIIMPWNFPFWQVFRAAVPALMAGNTVLLKHASAVCACSQTLQKIFTPFPKAAFQSLIIKGKQTDPLIADFRIKKVSFTGSTTVGCTIAQKSGENLKPHVLELGGNDAYLVLDDADVKKAVKTLVKGRMRNNGQSCIAAKRWLVHDKIYDQFLKYALLSIQNLSIGDPLDLKTDIGPVVSKNAYQELKMMLRMIQKEGHTVHTTPQSLPNNGYFIAPSIVEVNEQSKEMYNNLELFGPIALLYRCKSEKDMIQLANNTEYGLGSGVFTQDLKKGRHIAEFLLESGSSFVNSYVSSDPALPFGGIKKSGYGRELAREGLLSFCNIKTLSVQ